MREKEPVATYRRKSNKSTAASKKSGVQYQFSDTASKRTVLI
jgi:hypothetical protein